MWDPTEPRSGQAAEHLAPSRPGDVRHSLAATDEAFRELGFRARVDLMQGLESCLDFYRDAQGWFGPAEARRPSAIEAPWPRPS